MSILLEKARAGEPLGIDIIDMHGHMGRFRIPIADLSARSIINAMDVAGIQKFFFSHMDCMTTNSNEAHDEMYETIRKFSSRFYGYISPFPYSKKSVKDEVSKRVAQGFSGIKLHSANGFPYNSKEYDECYKIADDLCFPMLFHIWGKEDDFNDIKEISRKYPNTSILMAHAGAANEAGYIKIAKECKNVYLELAYSASPRGLVKRLVDAVGAEKIIWGSDCYLFNMHQQLGKVVGARISDEEKTLIFAENAKRILARSTILNL